jgi:hypothetical protein
MSKFWHVMASVGMASLAVVTPALQGVISSHPIVTTALGAAWAILGSLLKSPLASQS